MPDLNDPAEDALLGTADIRSEAFTWDAPTGRSSPATSAVRPASRSIIGGLRIRPG